MWRGRTLFEGITARKPDFVKKASQIGVTSWTGQATSGEGHIVLDFQRALSEGFSDMKKRVINLRDWLKLYEPEDLSNYEKDIKRGFLTKEDVLELILHFYLELFSTVKIRPEKHTRRVSGYPMFQNLVITGQTKDGVDATNELSYLSLSALAEV